VGDRRRPGAWYSAWYCPGLTTQPASVGGAAELDPLLRIVISAILGTLVSVFILVLPSAPVKTEPDGSTVLGYRRSVRGAIVFFLVMMLLGTVVSIFDGTANPPHVAIPSACGRANHQRPERREPRVRQWRGRGPQCQCRKRREARPPSLPMRRAG
jgi:hypothetical protein